MVASDQISMAAIAAAIDRIAEAGDETVATAAPALAGQLLGLGAAILEIWLRAHDRKPTSTTVEGFRLLALHRQAARGDPSFNACRETCRELVYRHNVMLADPAHVEIARHLRLAAMVARHLALFVAGKLEVAGLGEFCCSSRPLRQPELSATPRPGA